MTEFFYQSDVKEASGMSNIPFGLALIDPLILSKRHLVKKQEYYFSFILLRFKYEVFRKKIIPFEAVNSINGGTWTVQGGEIAFSLTDCGLP